jgi:hypothetical protein
VFTGVAVDNEGTVHEPVWSFTVNGVLKGEVKPTESVIGEDWGGMCGTDFSRFSEPIVVYARRVFGGLAAIGCMPTPTAEEFADRIAAVRPPRGQGPPAAVVSGMINTSDLAVLDAKGRTLARGNVGAGVVAHCPGTTLVAIVPYQPQGVVNLVDLAAFAVTEQRSIDSGPVFIAGGRVTCLDGGRRVVSVAGYGPNEGSVRIATSNADGADHELTISGISSAVAHPAGTVILLPTGVGEPLTTLTSTDLQPIVGGDVELPDGTSLIDGDVSPDGSQLVMLATMSGTPAEYDTGAAHIVVVGLVDGVPVAGSVTTIELATVGPDIEATDGAAKWIRWLDEASWVIERETVSTKRMEIIAIDGTQLLEDIDVGWGWGLAPIPGGILRARNGGLEVVGVDGTPVPGDPEPQVDYVDRILSVAHLVDAPVFSTDVPDPTPALTITPIEATGDAGPTSTPPTTDDSEDVASTVARQVGLDRQNADNSMPHWSIVLAVVVMVLALGCFLFWRSRAVAGKSGAGRVP